MPVHPVRLRKRLDPQSLVAAERHPVTGRLTPNGRRNKSRHAPKASLARSAVGVLAVGALMTAAAGGATAAVKASSDDDRTSTPAIAGPTMSPSPLASPATSAPAKASLPAPCQLVSQAAAQAAVGAPVDMSENKPTSCLYAGQGPSPFRTLEVLYDAHFDVNHVRQTLATAHVTATPIAGLGPYAFSHPAFVQTTNGTTQFLPAEAVVPVGDITVVISAITLDEGAGAALVNPARDQSAAVAVAKAALPTYLGQ